MEAPSGGAQTGWVSVGEAVRAMSVIACVMAERGVCDSVEPSVK